jgi:hypothetical protein
MQGLIIAFLICLGAQTSYWWHTRSYHPPMETVPPVPTESAVKALSFGDHQFFFRLLSLHMQNFGDTFGRFTPLKAYDYERLQQWLFLLDSLDNESDYIPTIVSYYFSQTQNPEDTRYLIEYLRKHSEDRLDKKWWWQTQAVYLANHKLKDKDLALAAALPLLEAKNVPIWVNQLPAFIYEQKGEFGDALSIMEHVKDNAKDLKPGELYFIEHFIKERLKALPSDE